MCLVHSTLHPTPGKCYHVLLTDKLSLASHLHSLSFDNASLNMNDSLGTNEQILERLKSFSKPDIREIIFLIKHLCELAFNGFGARFGLPEGGLALLIDARKREGDQEMVEMGEEGRFTLTEAG